MRGDRWPFIWDARYRTPRATYPGGGAETRLLNKFNMPPLFGLAPGGVYPAAPVTGGAVRSYRTLSPLPAFAPEGFAGRFAFCGTFPGVAPAGRYPAPCSRGARTFLPLRRRRGGRPSGRLARRSIVRNGAIGKARRTGSSIQALAHPVAPGFLGAVEALVGGFDQIFKAGDTGIFGAGGADAYCHMGRRLGGRVGDL